jgi:hypothetical protein
MLLGFRQAAVKIVKLKPTDINNNSRTENSAAAVVNL